MFNSPIRANDIEVTLFTSEEYGSDIEKLEFEVNAWLKNQPNNIVVQDIIYRHSGRTAMGKEIVSLLVISSPTKSAR